MAVKSRNPVGGFAVMNNLWVKIENQISGA
jgi:hypothetical protein